MKTYVKATSGWMVATLSLLALFLVSFSSTPVSDMEDTAVGMDPMLGEISMFAGNFAPRGWAFCNGQVLQIRDNQALFSILGTTYGGDGRTTFALPDLRGRAPIHAGRGPGLQTSYRLGQKGGAETLVHPPTVPINSSSSGRARVINAANPISNMQPFLSVNYIIAVQGTYPSRN